MTNRRRQLARGTVCLALALGGGCRPSESDVPIPDGNRVRFGFDIGDSISPLRVDCLKAGSRLLGTSGSAHVVTFSSPGDCSTCMPHLAGLDSIAVSGEGPADNVLVAFTPGRSPAMVARLCGSRLARDVCVDTSGAAWDHLHLNKTPVTVLLINGRVAYLTNADLQTASARSRFLGDIERALAAGRRHSVR